MSEIKTHEVLEILDKLEMFQGQRAGRELWADKPTEIQDKDLESFNRDVEIIRKYVKETQNVLERIVERLEEEATAFEDNFGELIDCIPEHIAIEIVREECGIE